MQRISFLYLLVTYNLMGHVSVKFMHIGNPSDKCDCGLIGKGTERVGDELRKFFQKEMTIEAKSYTVEKSRREIKHLVHLKLFRIIGW